MQRSARTWITTGSVDMDASPTVPTMTRCLLSLSEQLDRWVNCWRLLSECSEAYGTLSGSGQTALTD